jgi:hypothetical protein
MPGQELSSAAVVAAISSAPPEPRLLVGIGALALGLGLLVWARNKPLGEGRWAKLFGVMATVVGIGFVALYLGEIERRPFAEVLAMGLAIGLLLWSLADPAVGRRLVRTLAVLVLAVGAGLLFLGIATVSLDREFTIEDPDAPSVLREPIWVFGIGGAGLLAGVLGLVLSFVGARKKPGGQEPKLNDGA